MVPSYHCCQLLHTSCSLTASATSLKRRSHYIHPLCISSNGLFAKFTSIQPHALDTV